MRWRTYNRYEEQYDRYEEILDSGLQALAAKYDNIEYLPFVSYGVVSATIAKFEHHIVMANDRAETKPARKRVIILTEGQQSIACIEIGIGIRRWT